MKKVLLYFFAFSLLAHLLITCTHNTYLYKAVYHNFAKIDNWKIFPNRTLHQSPRPEPWKYAKYQHPLPKALNQCLETFNSVAFLVIKDDSIVLEKYWEGYSDTSHSNSFSMAKSYIATLIGCAIKDGYIASVNDPVGKYLPSFLEGQKKNITIKHVLQMASGLDWNESYINPFSVTTKAYYGDDIDKLVLNQKVIDRPGNEFKYLSGNTHLLSLILRNATSQSIVKYAQNKLWNPMGYTENAYWSLDSKNEKAYCCLNSNVKDFARLVKLYLQKGNWNGVQILDTAFVNKAITPSQYAKISFNDYGYQWWLLPDYKDHQIFYARGILGQYAIGIPEKNIIIVRLGHKRGKKINYHRSEINTYIDEVLKLFP